MESRRQKIPEYSEPLPVDLIFDILLRLPAKSLARCRCVSKPWAYILRCPDFTDLFMTRSCARPQLLFSCRKNGELLFFSSPQPQDLEILSPMPLGYLTKFAFGETIDMLSCINGLVCFVDTRVFDPSTGKPPSSVTVICNPSTGKSFTLPKRNGFWRESSLLGYDPVEKQFKVLSAGWSGYHQVLTLGTRVPSWRRIECGISHSPRCSHICINGVLYYKAEVKMSIGNSTIACFDVRNETFSFIQLTESFIGVVDSSATLVNYKGKLASLAVKGSGYISGTSTNFEFYVLEDPEKHEWSKHIYELPPVWHNVVGISTFLNFVGVTGGNEVMFWPRFPCDSFYVIYYNFERKTVKRVEIQGLGVTKTYQVDIFLNHVENLKYMQAF